MIQKISITLSILFLTVAYVIAQTDVPDYGGFGTGVDYGDGPEGREEGPDGPDHDTNEKKIPSHIYSWNLKDYGAKIDTAVVDTVLNYFHVYNPIYHRSLFNTFTGNLGGAYLSNDFFSRESHSDFYFYRSFDVYGKHPADIKYFNTTTPYTLLDYSQSENKNLKTENRFNVFHSQNVNKDWNFTFFYDQAKSLGQYRRQENKNSSLGLYSSYHSDHWNSHSNVIFNKVENQENGGLEPGQNLNDYADTETFLVNLLNARSLIRNRTVFLNNEYKIGKTVKEENEDGDEIERFVPITGIIHQFEYSGNRRSYIDDEANLEYYPAVYLDSTMTSDTVSFNRLTNIFQLKFYESPNRKYTFSKRAFIGFDRIGITMPINDSTLVKDKYSNTFVGGGIGREDGKFWKWGASGRLYLTGYRSGQTELSAFILKPLRIGNDTMSFELEGELNTVVPDYFQQKFISNHYKWSNRFDNTKEMIVRSKINSQKYKATVGLNYALIGNYIFNDSLAVPKQGGSEMLVVSAYANKDVETKHWLLRGKVVWQKSSQENYLHLPELSAYASMSYKTIISKVLYTQIGADVRYHSAFYADAFDPSTAQFYWQNQQKIGNFPNVDVHANLKLKRTRLFFQWLNATAGLLEGNFWGAPDYPYYRRTFRLGVSWSFYD